MSVNTKLSNITSSDTAAINPALFKELESLIQTLKNSQRCFAEAASLVNSSQLRNVFEKIELERTIFMQVVANSINRTDLISGEHSYRADIAWFSSIMINNVSKREFDLEVLSLCIQCEKLLYQEYKALIRLRAKQQIFVFLDKQQLKLEKTSEQLQGFYRNLKSLMA